MVYDGGWLEALGVQGAEAAADLSGSPLGGMSMRAMPLHLLSG